MLHRTAPIAVVLLGLLAAALSLRGADQILPPVSPDQGILVLRNGQTIEGRITRVDGWCVVDLPNGQIRIKAADVDLLCGSLEEGYRLKRAAADVGNVHDHLELAQWCLRQKLLGPAAAELADAKTADPTNRMIGVLEQRLKLALEPPPATGAAGRSSAGPSNAELDRMIRSLPRGTVEAFTQSVQPVLMNHCATGGCHGPLSDSGLRLFRVPTAKSAGRRITQRNLYSVLQLIDRESPAESRLLTAASGPHGSAKHAIFGQHEAAQYSRLVDWANQVAQPVLADSPRTLTPGASFEPADPVPVQSPPRTLSQDARRARPLPGTKQAAAASRAAALGRGKPAPDAAPASFDQPSDPFDPEVFNRRYAPQKPESKKEPPRKVKAASCRIL
jgi:hypothetical protein